MAVVGFRRPLFTAVREELENLIKQGVYPPDSQLPAEDVLARELGVSRVTLREALRVLEEDGVLSRQRGIGTFVNKSMERIVVRLERNLGISELLQSADQVREVNQVEISQENADSFIGRQLRVDCGAPVVCVERAIAAGGRPIVYTRDIIPGWVMGENRLDPSLAGGSLYRFLTEVCGQRLIDGVARVSPVKASFAVAGKLKVAPNTLLMVIDQVDRNEDDKRILYSREYYLSQVFDFRVLRRRD